ncbi:hypothetical protein [Nocardia cyriacigeorgica]|nr:hypothetical protein [Nocardia cyriacigeorgica]
MDTYRTRLIEFDGGVLEMADYGDWDDSDPGVYVELFRRDEGEDAE